MLHAQTAQIDYIVYTFEMQDCYSKDDHSPWKKHAILNNKDEAFTMAQVLFRGKQYKKIEIKKRFFDPSKNRIVDKTLKTYMMPTYQKKVSLSHIFKGFWANILSGLYTPSKTTHL